MRGSDYIWKSLAVALALLFGTLDLAGAAWAGLVVGNQLLPGIFIGGRAPGALLLVLIGVAAVLGKLVAAQAAASLWRCGQHAGALAAAAVALCALLYGCASVLVALVEVDGLASGSSAILLVATSASLLVGLMSGSSPIIAAALFANHAPQAASGEAKAAPSAASLEPQVGLAGPFIAQCTQARAGAAISAQALFEAYEAWCERSGLVPLAYVQFGKAISSLDLAKRKSGGRVLYLDITLMPISPAFSTVRDAGREAKSLPRGDRKRAGTGETAALAA